MPNATATEASLAWVLVRDGRLLAVRRRGEQRFSLPGGAPDAGETEEAALVRAVGDALGIGLTDVEPAFTVAARSHGLLAEPPSTLRCFRATPVGEPTPAGDVEEVAWLRIPVDIRAAPAVHAVLARLNR
jgi:ADP-ribose pyrophosphatase YjhB (NUDIX family)